MEATSAQDVSPEGTGSRLTGGTELARNALGLPQILFCIVTGRSMPINQSTRDYFDVGDLEDLAYEEKLERYRELADDHLQAAVFAEFRDAALTHLDEAMIEYIESAEFDELLVRIIRAEERSDMQELLIERTRALVRSWAADEHAAAR